MSEHYWVCSNVLAVLLLMLGMAMGYAIATVPWGWFALLWPRRRKR